MATYSPLPTEEPEDTIARPDTDKDDRKDKKTSVNISDTCNASCSTNNFCTGRRMYILLVAGIVCIFLFVAVDQTVLKAVVVVAAVAIIVVISYVIYLYVNKRADQTTQKNGEAPANEKKQDGAMCTIDPMVVTGDEEDNASRDGIEVIDPPNGSQSQALKSTPVIITEEDNSSSSEMHTIPYANQSSGFAKKASRYPGDCQSYTIDGVIFQDVSTENFVVQRGTGNVIHSMQAATGHTVLNLFGHLHRDDLKPYIDEIAKEMPADWQQLATNLGIPWSQIRAVNCENSRDCWMCCQQVLHMWRKNRPGATKEDLIQAVRETGNGDVAEKLEHL